jgi:hypothetical protein
VKRRMRRIARSVTQARMATGLTAKKAEASLSD